MKKSDYFVLLNMPDDGTINIDDVSFNEEKNEKIIHISRDPFPTYCNGCGFRMHSRGIKKRTVNHPVMQDGSRIKLIIRQRRWKCPNCSHEENESFPFIEPHKQSSSITPLLVLDAMKDINRTAVSVARQFNLSDSTVHDIFTKYVDLKRLSLPEYISIDEVYLNISNDMKYAFVIMDFSNGQIVDIVHNRWSSTLEEYFLKIPLAERRNVRGIISDAYGPYQNLCERFFPNAKAVLDSFHVVRFIINRLNGYINELLRKHRKKQQDKLQEKNFRTNRDSQTIKDSEEIILLRDYRWLLLKNREDINYGLRMHYHKKLGMSVNTFALERKFFELDRNLTVFRDLKEKYIDFNNDQYDSLDDVEKRLTALINEYYKCNHKIFIEFADFLLEHFDGIVRSFSITEVSRKTKKDQEAYYSRLSNGPMESFNRKPKDLKRNSRGFSNFDYTRNRILWSTRDNPPILGIPKSNEEIHSYHKKKK